jgi:hypothetical protein
MPPGSTFARAFAFALAVLCLFPACQRYVSVAVSDDRTEQRRADYASLAHQLIRIKQQSELNSLYVILSTTFPDLHVGSIIPTEGGSGFSSIDVHAEGTYWISFNRPVSESEFSNLVQNVNASFKTLAMPPNLDDSIAHWDESFTIMPYEQVIARIPPGAPRDRFFITLNDRVSLAH